MPKQNDNPNSRKRDSDSILNRGAELKRILAAIALKLGKIGVQLIKVLFSIILNFGAWLLKFPSRLRAIPRLLRSMLIIMTAIGVFMLVFLPDEQNKDLIYEGFFPIYMGMVVWFLISYFYTIQIRKRLILRKLRNAYLFGLNHSSLNPRIKRKVSNGS